MGSTITSGTYNVTGYVGGPFTIDAGGELNNELSGTINTAGSFAVGVYLDGGSLINDGLIEAASASGTLAIKMAAGESFTNDGKVTGASYAGVAGSTDETIGNSTGDTIQGNYFAVHIQSGTVSNSGTLANTGLTHYVVYEQSGGLVQNTKNALIDGSNGIGFATGTGTLDNYGTILANSSAGGLGGNFNQGGIVTTGTASLIKGNRGLQFNGTSSAIINNSGTIDALVGPGIEAFNASTVNITNSVSGTILSVSYAAEFESGTVDNYGLIDNSGTYDGLFIQGNGDVTNAVGGLIEGGIGLELFYGLLDNYGSVVSNGSITPVRGFAGEAAYITGGTVYNGAGAYIGGYAGLLFGANASDTLTNNGTIEATGTTNEIAVRFGAGNDLLRLGESSNIIGKVSGGTGNNELELLSGTSTGTVTGIGSTITLFPTIQVESGGTWELTGTNAFIAGYTVTIDGTLTNAGSLLSNGTFVDSGSLINTGTIDSTSVTAVTITAGNLNNQAAGTIEGVTAIFSGTAGATITNSGIIDGTVINGIYLTQGGYVDNAGTAGTISGLEHGIVIENVIGTVVNAGAISNTSAGAEAVYLEFGGSFTNTGTASQVTGQTVGVTVENATGTIGNAGTIIGTTADGILLALGGSVANTGTAALIDGEGFLGIYFGGPSGTLVNSGTIEGSTGSGVSIANSGTVSNQAGGLIKGFTGIKIGNGAGTITNNGTVLGTSGVAIYLDSGGSVTNRGTVISSLSTGVYLRAGGYVYNTVNSLIDAASTGVEDIGGIGTLANAGTIETSGVFAVDMGNAADLVDYHAGALFIGTVSGGGGTLELSAGTVSQTTLNSFGTHFTDFSELEIDAYTSWELGSDISIVSGVELLDNGTLTFSNTLTDTGTITISSGGLLEGTGNDVLDLAAGATLAGSVEGGGGNNTLELSIGVGYGTLNGFGTNFTEFQVLSVASGADWVLAGSNTIRANYTLENHGTVKVTGSLDNEGSIAGNITLAGGYLLNDTGAILTGLVYATGGETLTNAGSIVSSAFYGVYFKHGGKVDQTGTAALVEGQNGIWFQTVAGTVLNDGTVEGTAGSAIYMGYGGYASNASSGVIDATTIGIKVLTTSGTIVNAGLIEETGVGGFGVYLQDGGTFTNSGTASSIEAYTNGLEITNGTGTVDNAGTIIGTHGMGVWLYQGGTVTNSGTASVIEGRQYGVFLDVNGGTLVNQGTIQGGTLPTSMGVFIRYSGAATNAVHGLIDGVYGVAIGGVGTISNLGTIIGTAGFGISMADGGSLTNAATGLIEGSTKGVQIGLGIGTVVNAGTIDSTGSGGSAVLLDTAGGLVQFDAGAVFGGVVNDAGGGGTLELSAGTAAIGTLSGFGTNFLGFTQLDVDANTQWTLTNANSIGAGVTLTNAGTVTFGGTLADAGTISVSSGGLLQGAGNDVLDLAAGAVLSGSVDGGTGANTLELASGTGIGTLNGFGSSFTNFQTLYVDSGADWSLAGTNTIQVGETLEDHGTIGVSGTFTDLGDISIASGGELDLSGPTDVFALGVSAGITGSVNGANGTLALASGSGTGTLTGLGTEFKSFSEILVEAGAAWTLNGNSTLGAAYTLAIAGLLTNTAALVEYGSIVVTGTLNNSPSGTIIGKVAGGTVVTVTGTGSVDNQATIQALYSGATALAFDSTGQLTNTGVVEASAYGIALEAGNGAFVNDGGVTVSGTNGIGIALLYSGSASNHGTVDATGIDGIGLELATGGSAYNASLIEATGVNGKAVYLDSKTHVTNLSTGLVVGTEAGIYASTAATYSSTVANFGTIEGTLGRGVFLGDGGYLANGAAGTINPLIYGYGDGVELAALGTVENWATIQSTAATHGIGIYLEAGGTVANNGTAALIEGSYYGVLLDAAAKVINTGSIYGGDFGVEFLTGGTLVNAGTIDSHGTAVVVFDGAGGLVQFDAGAVFGGVVNDVGGGGTLELSAGTAAIGTLNGFGTYFLGFTQLKVDANTQWTLTNANSIGAGVTLTDAGTVNFSGTFTDAGAITVSSGGLLQGSGNDILHLDAGAVLYGSVDGGIGSNTLELSSGAGIGTLNGFGTSITHFQLLSVDTGADWLLAGSNTILSGYTLHDTGTITSFGNFVDEGTVSIASGAVFDLGSPSYVFALGVNAVLDGTVNGDSGTLELLAGAGTGVFGSTGTLTNFSVVYIANGAYWSSNQVVATGGSILNYGNLYFAVNEAGAITLSTGAYLLNSGALTSNGVSVQDIYSIGAADIDNTGTILQTGTGSAGTYSNDIRMIADGSVTNSGTIIDAYVFSRAVELDAGGGVYNAGYIGGVETGVFLGLSGTITNMASGTIQANEAAGFTKAVVGAGTPSYYIRAVELDAGGSVYNAGYIDGIDNGIFLKLSGTITNTVYGTIEASGSASVAAAVEAGTISNTGTIIDTGSYGTALDVTTGSGTNVSGGTITATNYVSYAVCVNGSGGFTNYGIILDTGDDAAGMAITTGSGTNDAYGLIEATQSDSAGVFIIGTGSFINQGTVLNSGSGWAINLSAAGSVTNTSNGSIVASGAMSRGINLAAGGSADNQGYIGASSIGVFLRSGGSLYNGGSIQASGSNGVGAYLYAGGTVTNNGMIEGGAAGAYLHGGSLANYRSIVASGAGGIGVAVSNGGTLVNAAGAVISGAIGVELLGNAATLVNGGEIDGAGGYAVVLGGKNDLLTWQIGASVTGKIAGGGGTLDLAAGIDQEEEGGTLTGLGTYFSHFSLIDIDADADWTLAGAGTLTAAYSIDVAGTLSVTGTLKDDGAISVTGSLIDDGLITIAHGNTLSDASALYGSGTIDLSDFSVLELSQGASGGTIDFTDGTGILSLADASYFDDQITGFLHGDTIDLTGIAYSASDTISYSGGYATLYADSEAVAHLALSGVPTGATLALQSDLHGGTDIVDPVEVTPSGTYSGYDATPITLSSAYAAVTVTASGTIDAASAYGVTVENAAGTVTDFGTIEGMDGAVRFTSGAYADRVIDEVGAVFIGAVRGGGADSVLELASGGGAGTIAGLGSQFIDFGTVEIDSGAEWDASGSNTVAGLTNDGTLTLEAGAFLDIAGALSGAGTIEVKDGALDLGVNVASANLAFTGAGGLIELTQGGTYTGVSVHIHAGDTIVLASQIWAQGDKAVFANGKIKLKNSSGATLDSVAATEGANVTGFKVVDDGGKTVIEALPLPPAGVAAIAINGDAGALFDSTPSGSHSIAGHHAGQLELALSIGNADRL